MNLRLADCVSLDLALLLRRRGFDRPTDKYYRRVVQDGKTDWITTTDGLTVKGEKYDKNYNNPKLTEFYMNVIQKEYASAPRYYEVLDWLLDNGVLVSFDDAIEMRIKFAVDRLPTED